MVTIRFDIGVDWRASQHASAVTAIASYLDDFGFLASHSAYTVRMRVMRNIGSSIDPPTRSRECILRLVKVAEQATRNWLTSLATHTHTHKYTLHDNKNHRMHHEKCQAGSPTNNYSLPRASPPHPAQHRLATPAAMAQPDSSGCALCTA